MSEFDPYLREIIMQYEVLGMMLLGKVPSRDGEVHKDLEQVRAVVGLLEMLERKTRGNLSEDEQRELRRVLTLLRLNYVEEANRSKSAPQAEAGAQAGAGAEASAQAEESKQADADTPDAHSEHDAQ
ncbi:MAG: DUF1844 domain-containing protein [Candidatus Eisenbacteria bacterium]|nr:DUF1844 domain-containing protein [Candidatus Eisenbacteria bacterium]